MAEAEESPSHRTDVLRELLTWYGQVCEKLNRDLRHGSRPTSSGTVRPLPAFEEGARRALADPATGLRRPRGARGPTLRGRSRRRPARRHPRRPAVRRGPLHRPGGGLRRDPRSARRRIRPGTRRSPEELPVPGTPPTEAMHHVGMR
ncbi:hypothetical protein NKH77_01270 [Streptomyces sp. M19]